MAAKKSTAKRRKRAGGRKRQSGGARRRGARSAGQQRRESRDLFVRVPVTTAEKRGKMLTPRSEADVPEARIRRDGGPVTVEIAFGHAQHGNYTIQLFDPTGDTELSRETGLSTDQIPDRFELQRTAAQLDQHLLQWSGSVSAFSSAPGQQFSVIFDVSQNGQTVPGGHVEITGPLDRTETFLSLLRLVA